MTTWNADILGEGFVQHTIELGVDPDGESPIVATLVCYRPDLPAPTGPLGTLTGSVEVAPGTAVDADTAGAPILYVHGYTDYFFQRHIAEHLHARGHRFYALDLRKSGRSRRPGQTPHFVSDLSLYDAELERALSIVRTETGRDVLMMAHSTGGLIVPLWLDRRRSAGGNGVIGEVLNSPWFDLQGPAVLRSPLVTAVLGMAGRRRPTSVIPGQSLSTYGSSISADQHGEWTYDPDFKPLTGFPVRYGWLRAVRRGQAHLHHGIDVGVPSLVLRSGGSYFAKHYVPEVDSADAVLDVNQIARWSGCLGSRVTVIPIDGARHDIFLSVPEVRARALAEVDSWIDTLADNRSTEPATDSPRRQTGSPVATP